MDLTQDSEPRRRVIQKVFTFIRSVLYWGLILIAAFAVLINFLKVWEANLEERSSWERMINGTADRPFAYRVFLPVAANFLAPVLPPKTARLLGKESEIVFGDKIFMKDLSGRSHPGQAIWVLVIIYVSLAGFAITLWHLIRKLNYSLKFVYIAPPILLLGCMVFISGHGYLYDFPQLFFFSAGLLLMYSEQWVWFLLVFACGALNKETTIFLYPVFAIYFFGRMRRPAFAALSAWQIGLYTLIRVATMLGFRNNPGSIMEWHLSDQIASLRDIVDINLSLLVCWIMVGTIIAVLLIYRWKYKPLFMRFALCILPAFLVLYFLWGYPLEMRVFLEIYPIVAILTLPPGTSPANTQVEVTTHMSGQELDKWQSC